jgi:hypothetical protein
MRLPCVVWCCLFLVVLSVLRIMSLYTLALHRYYETADEGGVGSRFSTGRGQHRSRLQSTSLLFSQLSGDAYVTFRTLLQLTVTFAVLVVTRHQFAEALDSCGLGFLSPLLSEHYSHPDGAGRDFSDMPALDGVDAFDEVPDVSADVPASSHLESGCSPIPSPATRKTPLPPDWLVFDETLGVVPLSTQSVDNCG